MSEEHKESLQHLRKPRQIVTNPANSCQLQSVTELSVASAEQEPALTQRQQLALIAMVSVHSIAAAARQSGVSERSIQAVRHEPSRHSEGARLHLSVRNSV